MKKLLPILSLGLLTAFLVFKVDFTTEKVSSNAKKHVLHTAKQKPITDPYQHWLDNKTAKKRAGHAKAEKPELHGIIQRELRTRDGDETPNYGPNQVMEEFLKAKSRSQSAQARMENFEFVERGPGNVGGRTRALIADPDDPNQQTFFAGAASGGIWKTTNNGADWTYLSGDIPNLGTNTLAMAPSNTQVIYAGTGEHFTNDIDGAGMFKSTDKGNSWTQIASPSTYPDFKNVSRIVVDPADENTVIATTRSTVWGSFRSSIYKTTDGGTTWTQLRTATNERYDDIDYDPSNFNTLYVAIDGKGVIKSTDGGSTWSNASTGMSPGGRVEITVSPVNTNRIWASVEGNLSGSGSDLYVSNDGAQTWLLAVNESGDNENFLGGQGWYDNIITAHPYDANKVYVGGVNTFLFELQDGAAQDVTIIKPVEYGSEEFMDFVNFGGGFLGGGMDLGEDLPEEDFLPIEIRFGNGTQLAHRFTVGGAGPGVPPGNYIYEDYVEVPFQVWDTRNDRQLMASFRDQQEDGLWNLIGVLTDGATENHSREYLYVHNITYAETAADTIAVNGGHEVGQMYFFWPVLAAGATFDAANLPDSKLAVEFQVTPGILRATTSVSDAYGEFDGPNGFPQSTREQGLHPDQHNIVIYDKDDASQSFRLLTGNDGGVYTSVKSSLPGPNEDDYEFISYGYNTTQFYGADKAPGQNRYIGGTQDNGTWYHVEGTEGGANVNARFAIGGDGFEALWHSADPQKIIGGSQFNNFARTLNGGSSWSGATNGFDDDGPFITRLAHHKQLPDRIFTVGAAGVWKSEDFGGVWTASTMNDAGTWSFTNSADVEVSYANPDVVWAGGIMNSNSRLHVSTDGGKSFDETANYTEFNMGSVSGIGTHPTQENTAYALFSFAGYPKVLKTIDLGQNWEDISGFDGTGAASTRGFPDVAVNCLFVFPDDINRIWVGSEIGIIESLDGGASWNLMQSNLPPVNVYDFKLADDQLVIATYGRGIWSVTLDGIVVAPVVDNVSVAPSGELNFAFTFSESFDSVQVFLGNEMLGTLYDNSLGSVSQKLQNKGLNGNQKVRLDAYAGGLKYSSLEKTVFVFEPKASANSFKSTFSNAISDFIGYGMRIQNAVGFSSIALHSSHPYEDNSESIFYLKTPIIVSGDDDTFNYSDVAIVEPGEPGAVFGDETFWDYVVVEASKDGLTWIPLEDGYDASLHQEWLDAYSDELNGTADLLKDHSVHLRTHFTAGDEILIRFRMFADAGVNAYGWVIDDLYIQEQPLGTEKAASGLLTVYPNPISEMATFRFDSQVPEMITIIDLQGRTVDKIITQPGDKNVTWNRKQLKAGIYMARFELDGQAFSKKIRIQ